MRCPQHRSRPVMLILVAAMAALGGLAAWSLWGPSGAPPLGRARLAPLDGPGRARRLDDEAAKSPYANVRPGVRYVGDAACARCHEEIAETYRTHPMGRS